MTEDQGINLAVKIMKRLIDAGALRCEDEDAEEVFEKVFAIISAGLQKVQDYCQQEINQ